MIDQIENVKKNECSSVRDQVDSQFVFGEGIDHTMPVPWGKEPWEEKG